MSTTQTKAARARKNKADKASIAPMPSVEVNHAQLGSQIAEIEAGTLDQHKHAVARLRELALTCSGMLPEQFDELIKPTLLASLVSVITARSTSDKPENYARSRCAMYKVAFLAMAHGLVPSAGANISNLAPLARKHLDDVGVRAQGAGGRKKGDTEHAPGTSKGRSAREEAAYCLAQTGGVADDVVEVRVSLLLHCTKAANWKAFEVLLVEYGNRTKNTQDVTGSK